MGALIGCLALGSALPHLIEGLGRLNWRAVLAAAAAIAFCAAIVAGALLRPGPQFPAGDGAGRSRYALAMFADRGPGWSASPTSATCGSCTRCGPGCRHPSP